LTLPNVSTGFPFELLDRQHVDRAQVGALATDRLEPGLQLVQLHRLLVVFERVRCDKRRQVGPVRLLDMTRYRLPTVLDLLKRQLTLVTPLDCRIVLTPQTSQLAIVPRPLFLDRRQCFAMSTRRDLDRLELDIKSLDLRARGLSLGCEACALLLQPGAFAGSTTARFLERRFGRTQVLELLLDNPQVGFRSGPLEFDRVPRRKPFGADFIVPLERRANGSQPLSRALRIDR
jgi:hypothetical protein